MKLNRKIPGILSCMTVLFLIAALTLFFYSDALREQIYSYYGAAERELFGELSAQVNKGGVPALDRVDLTELARDILADRSPGDAASEMCAMLLDSQGQVLARTGALDIGIGQSANLLLARYEREYVDSVTGDGQNTDRHSGWGRLCLIVDAAGEITGRLMAKSDSESETPLTLKIIGAATPDQYDRYFPLLNEREYIRVSDSTSNFNVEELLSAEDPEGAQAARGKASFETAERYVQWEEEQIALAGDLRVVLAPLLGEQSGRVLALFYRSNSLMSAAVAQRQANWRRFDACYLAFLFCLLAYWLTLAIWVFRDAKRRGFRPAMWALLTLIGNLVVFLIYRLVRPERQSVQRCPQCQTPILPTFAFCPACGERMRDRCAACHRALETAWKICPYCGTPASDPEKENA